MDNQETEGRIEQTLFLIKPDGLQKSLTGNILTKLSETGMRLVGSKVLVVPRELAEEHYHKLKEEKGEADDDAAAAEALKKQMGL